MDTNSLFGIVIVSLEHLCIAESLGWGEYKFTSYYYYREVVYYTQGSNTYMTLYKYIPGLRWSFNTGKNHHIKVTAPGWA